MRKITKHYKRLKVTYIKTTLIMMFGAIMLSKGFITFEKTGENYFHIQVNGQEVGCIGNVEKAEELLTQARRNIAMQEEELVFMDVDMTFTGEEVLWGRVDDRDLVVENMEKVLRSGIKETMQRSYTVKVNEYMVNLSNVDEVKALLQAALDKYDSEQKFTVDLVHDSNREFNVLTADVVEREAIEEEAQEGFVMTSSEAGIQTLFNDITKNAEPEKEKGFEDYELGLISMDFSEEVEIVEAYLPQNQISTMEAAIDEVTKEQETKTIYEVVSGDTLSEISIKVNIPIDTLVEMNEELEDENSTIRVGQELVITIPEPELSVERREENYYEEIYDADVIYVDEDSWYTNQTQVLQQPSAGFRKVIAIESYLNDKQVDREIVKEEVVAEAVPKIVKRGTKIPPTYIKPISGGRLSSPFGRRSAPKKGASTYHKGIDWAIPTGSAVVASCGGTVVRAGWGSGYGYVVYINHEDGRQTRYGHLSKVLVKTGEKVKQGERIALSGNTGVSTGPHLHFEILINGKQVNPAKYME